MTLYLLQDWDCSTLVILGVFTTREKAEESQAYYNRPQSEEWQDDDDPPLTRDATIVEIPADVQLGDSFDWRDDKERP